MQSLLVLLEGAGTRDVLVPAFVGKIFVVFHFLVRAVRVVNRLASGDVVVLTLFGNQNLLAAVEIDATGVLDKLSEGLVPLRHLPTVVLGFRFQHDSQEEFEPEAAFNKSKSRVW